MITPIPYYKHAPSGTRLYTSPSDWRQQHVAGNIPMDTTSMSRWWNDSSAVLALNQSTGIPGFPQFGSGVTKTFTYRIPVFDMQGNPVRVALGSSGFYNSYALSSSHDAAVRTMIQYHWVYELFGLPIRIDEVTLSASQAAVENFGSMPNYPIEVRSDHVYFMQENNLVALPIQDFITFFKPNTTDYSSMRATVLGLANDTRLSDKQAVSMIRLAVQEVPQTPPLI